MNEWAIVSVLLTLATLIGFFVKVTSTYERTTTKLTVAVENLQKCMEDMKISKEKTHERIFGLLDNQDEVLGNHENRIQKLEDKK